MNDRRYYISTGSKGAQFTLRCEWLDRGYLKDNYVCNLGTNPEVAVEKARRLSGQKSFTFACGKSLNPYGSNEDSNDAHDGHVVQFGKYRGYAILDAIAEDPNWVMWYADDTSAKVDPCYDDELQSIRWANVMEHERRSEERYLASLNRAPITWKEGDKIQFTGEVIKAESGRDKFGYHEKYTVKSFDGNLFWFKTTSNSFADVTIGSKITVKGTVSGVKDTMTFIKSPKCINIV
jgi:hypothetical protein